MLIPLALPDRIVRRVAPCLALLVALFAVSGGPIAEPLEVYEDHSLGLLEDDETFATSDLSRRIALPEAPWPLALASCQLEPTLAVASRTVFTDSDELEPAAASSNLPKEVPGKDRKRSRSLSTSVALEVRPEIVPFIDPAVDAASKPLAGVKLHIVNQWHRPLAFESSKGVLYIVQQALDANGVWRDIERFAQRATCVGPGRYALILEPGQHWEVVGRRYGGSVPTLLRFKLELYAAVEWLGPLNQHVVERWNYAPEGNYLRSVHSAPFFGSVSPQQLDPLIRCMDDLPEYDFPVP